MRLEDFFWVEIFCFIFFGERYSISLDFFFPLFFPGGQGDIKHLKLRVLIVKLSS